MQTAQDFGPRRLASDNLPELRRAPGVIEELQENGQRKVIPPEELNGSCEGVLCARMVKQRYG